MDSERKRARTARFVCRSLPPRARPGLALLAAIMATPWAVPGWLAAQTSGDAPHRSAPSARPLPPIPPLPDLRPGDRVRVTAPRALEGRLSARVLRWNADTLYLDEATGPVLIPRAAITRLERHAGTRRGSPALVAGGAGVGLVIGILSAQSGSDCQGESTLFGDLCRDLESMEALLSPFAGAGLGALVGWLVGQTVTSDRWEDARLPEIDVSVRPGRGGPEVLVRLALP